VGEGEQVTEQEIIDHCRGRIAHYKCPKKVEFRDAIPRTATGKIQKFKLREAFWSTSERQVH
jgi:acyl-CoA synthetase (AMP-forming)/AMP-acid ligase II